MTDTKALAKISKTAAGIVAPEVVIPEILAEKGAVTAAQVLTGDIVVIRVAYPRGTKKKPLPPLDVEYHVNLASIGIGAFFLALAAVGISLAWNGVQTLGGGWTGLKGSSPIGGGGGGGGGSGGGGGNTLLCGPACIAAHVFDPWNIPACVAQCVANGGP